MPLRKSAISAAVSVTGTSAGFDPPFASRSGLTPRDPADETVWLLAFSWPSGLRPDSPNLLPPDFVSEVFASAFAGAAAAPPDATCATGTGLYGTDCSYRAATTAAAAGFWEPIT